MTKQEHRAQVAKLAKEAFKDHKLHQEGPGRWFCAKPGTGIYSFHVACFNGCVVLYGDVGELILRPSDKDSLAWLCDAIDSMDYVLGKAPNPWPEREFLKGEMERELSEMGGELAGKVKECFEDSLEMMPDSSRRRRRCWRSSRRRPASRNSLTLSGIGDEQRAMAWDWACFSNNIDDWSRCCDWSSDMLWTYHALETFCGLVGQDKDAT